MNVDLLLMLGSLILLAISGLLVFCFTESKGKNTPYARRHRTTDMGKDATKTTDKQISMNNELV